MNFPQRCVFQFHKGSINTDDQAGFNNAVDLFQFHKGSINTMIWRLYHTYILLFQFHKGSINTALTRANDGTTIVSIP